MRAGWRFLAGWAPLLFVGGWALLLFLGGCRFVSTPIKRVLEHPERYQGRQVTVAGRVEGVRWIPETGVFAFRLVDGSDSLLVLTPEEAPAAGGRLRLEGELSRRFPVEGADRVVLFYQMGGGNRAPGGHADTR